MICAYCNKAIKTEVVNYNKEPYHHYCLPLQKQIVNHYDRLAIIHKEFKKAQVANASK